jgi:hypothetical protein
VTTPRSPGETLLDICKADCQYVDDWRHWAASVWQGVASKFAAPYLARIAELESAYHNADNERSVLAAREDAARLRITELEADVVEYSKHIEWQRGRIEELEAYAAQGRVDSARVINLSRELREVETERVNLLGVIEPLNSCAALDKATIAALEAENKALRDAAAPKYYVHNPGPDFGDLCDPEFVMPEEQDKPTSISDHVHELGLCTFCDRDEPNKSCATCKGFGEILAGAEGVLCPACMGRGKT